MNGAPSTGAWLALLVRLAVPTSLAWLVQPSIRKSWWLTEEPSALSFWCHLKQEQQTKQPTLKSQDLKNAGIKTHGTSPTRLRSGGQTCCFEINEFILSGMGKHAALKLLGSFYWGVTKWTASKGWILRVFLAHENILTRLVV